jgi:hypothetical protein
MRAQIANRLANDGPSWTALFGEHNGGTDNLQWVVTNYALFSSRFTDALPDNSVWVLEQMPGAVFSRDVSALVSRQSYWASFNRPYFTQVYEAMGYGVLNASYPSLPWLFSYEGNYRQSIIVREQSTMSLDVAGMQSVMRFNQYATDVFSHGSPVFSISARYDLSTAPDPVPEMHWYSRGLHGGIDTKATCAEWMGVNRSSSSAETTELATSSSSSDPSPLRLLRVSAINGPTTEGGALTPPFSWLDPEWSNASLHIGMPDTFDFGFVHITLTPEPRPSTPTDPCDCTVLQTCRRKIDGETGTVTAECVLSTAATIGFACGGGALFVILVLCAVRWLRSKRAHQKHNDALLQQAY